MKTKAEIVENWLPRYTQHPLSCLLYTSDAADE